jgi:hypothetical protein
VQTRVIVAIDSAIDVPRAGAGLHEAKRTRSTLSGSQI